MDVPVLSRHGVDRRTTDRADEALLDEAWTSPSAKLISLTLDGLTPLRLGALAAEPTSSARPPDAYYLGRESGDHWFAQVVDAPPRGKLAGLRESAEFLDARDAGLFVHAVALMNWHATHTHCPRCGAPTEIRQGGHVRVCPTDGSEHFPRTDPAVIMLITDPVGERALLGRQPAWPSGRYSCLAGFVEPGESAEQAVIRESAEEASVTVTSPRYLGSQPWPFPASLMLAFRCTADPDEVIDVSLDELEDARWFSREEVRAGAASGSMVPGSVSIARGLIDDWLAEG